MKEYKAALGYSNKALQINPNKNLYIQESGRILENLQRKEEAVQLYKTYLESFPNDNKIINSLS